MFSFCPHCGRTTGQEQVEGQKLICEYCGKVIGVVAAAPKKVVIDETEELIRRGVVARCPLCNQVVELRSPGNNVRGFAPHLARAGPRKMCPNSGKQLPEASPAQPPSPPRVTSTGKDLSAYLSRDIIKVISCGKQSDPRIEELTLEYLDKSDRVRIQIEAVREILGTDFRLKAYPAQLQKPHLGLWGNGLACVIARKHEQGGYQQLTDSDIASVLADINQYKQLFFE